MDNTLYPLTEAETVREKMLVDMAVSLSAMLRVFRPGSKLVIDARIQNTFRLLAGVAGRQDFETLHADFCEWFHANIYTSRKVLKNKRVKESCPASYGQAGKLLNVALKVYVYYCRLPSPQAAQKLLPFLHGAVDTLMMEHLKKSFPQVHVPATTIEAVDKVQYFTLQAMIKRDIESEFGASILPVQWDDIMWCRLNRTDPYFHPS